MTDLENIQARRSAILRELANLNSSNPGGRPNIKSSLGGVVDHIGYKDSLYKELKELDELEERISGPWEYSMRHVS